MNEKRHFFYLGLSVVNTSIFVLTAILFSIGFISNLVFENQNNAVIFGICLGLSAIVGISYLVLDGWAYWQVKDGKLKIHMLFRKTKSIRLLDIIHINESVIHTIFIDMVEELKCFCISDGNAFVRIPMDEASKTLICEISKMHILP